MCFKRCLVPPAGGAQAGRLPSVFCFHFRLVVYLFMTVPGLRYYAWAFSSCRERGLFPARGALPQLLLLPSAGSRASRLQWLQYAGFIPQSERESHSVVSDSLRPRGLYRPWNSPGQLTGVGSLSLLQGISPTQGSNPGPLHCRQILYQLSHQGSPGMWNIPGLGIELCPLHWKADP